MSSESLELQGIVRYILTPEGTLDARWISSRITQFKEPGTGHATRIWREVPTFDNSWEGEWEISYFQPPDGKLAVMPFKLTIWREGQIYHGGWATLEGKPLLEGFGFEEDGKLFMRYGT